jgi:hypothetical protein
MLKSHGTIDTFDQSLNHLLDLQDQTSKSERNYGSTPNKSLQRTSPPASRPVMPLNYSR